MENAAQHTSASVQTLRLLLLSLLALTASLLKAADSQPFLEQHCYDCHDAETKKGGLDLATLQTDFANPKVFAAWVRVHDRVAAGEMPPPKRQQRPDAQAVKAFTDALEGRLLDFVAARQSATGRVVARRLTREEYERTLHELLGVRIPLAELLPEDVKTGGFHRIADGQPLSAVLLERYLEAADAALETAFDLALHPREPSSRSFDVDALVQASPWFYGGPPDAREGYAAIWNYFVADHGGGKFYGRLPATTVRETGWQRVTLRARALHPREGHVRSALHGGGCDTATPQLHWIGWLDATPEPRQFVFEAWMNRGDMLRLRPVDNTSAWKGRVREGDRLVLPAGRTPEDASIPGVAVEWLRVERLADGLPAEEVRRRLFGASGVAPGDEPSLEALVRDFAERAFRRPVVGADLAPQLALAREALRSGESATTALRTAYLGILTSPRFIFLQEKIGALDGHALAARLSYFLWSLPPDAELRRLAAAGRLREPEVLRAQTDRLLDDPRSRNFIESFTAQWLDLDKIDFTVLSGLSHPEVGGGHNSESSFLTAAPYSSTAAYRNTQSLDQLMAERLGAETRFASLVLSANHLASSYTPSGAMIRPEQSPSKLFARLFVTGTADEQRAQLRRARAGRSVLDAVAEDTRRLQRDLGPGDRDKLEAWLTNVRAVEQRLATGESWAAKPKPHVGVPPPRDIADVADLAGRERAMLEVMALALQTDSTRFITLHLQGGAGVPPIAGVAEGHHNLSHHGLDDGKTAQLRLIEAALITAVGDFLRRLRDAAEGGASVLDHTTVLLGSNLGNASNHDTKNLPILVAGGGFKHAGHLAFDRARNEPLANLYVSILQRTGPEQERFASSTGTLRGLAAG